jgi:hypothetical protein
MDVKPLEFVVELKGSSSFYVARQSLCLRTNVLSTSPLVAYLLWISFILQLFKREQRALRSDRVCVVDMFTPIEVCAAPHWRCLQPAVGSVTETRWIDVRRVRVDPEVVNR